MDKIVKEQALKAIGDYIREETADIPGILETLPTKEDKANKVSQISSSPTDTQYPSAKATKDYVDTAIENIELQSDVIDVIGTYQDLLNYDTSDVKLNDLIKVITDSTHSDAISYYRWEDVSGTNQWVFVASEGPYYTISQADNKFVSKATYDSVTGDKDFSGWINFNQDGTTTAARTTQVPSHNNDITPKWYVDSKENLIEITWSALKNLRDNSQLIPGRFYRITDYECTTLEKNTSSADHAFDIIVRANSTNKLDEKASAIQHANDTYFADNKLEAWQLWYCLDNDATRFAWAMNLREAYLTYMSYPYRYFREPRYDGVQGNYCWYDTGSGNRYIFTSTLDAPTTGSQWTRSGSTWQKQSVGSVEYFPASSIEGKGVIYRMIDEFGNDVPYDFKNILFTDPSKTPKYTNAYTFTYIYKQEIKDASLSEIQECYGNVMGEYMYTIQGISTTQQLNFNVFYSTLNGLYCHSNTFGPGCDHNTFGEGCVGNIIFDTFSDNIVGESFSGNIIGSECCHNTIGDSFYNNIIGHGFVVNTIGDDFGHNLVGNDVRSNTIGNNCDYSTFGDGFKHNTIGSSASENVYTRYCKFDDGIQYTSLISDTSGSSSNRIQNVHIHSGVKGTRSTIKTITVDRNLSYTLDVYPKGSTEMFI